MSSSPTTRGMSDKHMLDAALQRISALEMSLQAKEEQIAMVGDTNERLRVQNQKLKLTVQEQKVQIVGLQNRVDILEAQLLKNSSNSSMPPSSDKPHTPRTYPAREKSDRKQGGQEGHAGSNLSRAEPTETVHLPVPTKCPECQSRKIDKLTTITRQVQDVEIIIVVQDVVGTKVNWKCGHTSNPEFPTGITAPVVYGPGIKALGLGLYNLCQTSVGNVTDFLTGFMGLSVSEGTVLAWSKKLGACEKIT